MQHVARSERQLNSSIRKYISTIIGVILTVVLMFVLCQTEANAEPSNNYLSEAELVAASLRTAGAADEIMSADDFLDEGERAADYEDIHDYLDSIKENGIEITSTSSKISESITEPDSDIEEVEEVNDEDTDEESEDVDNESVEIEDDTDSNVTDDTAQDKDVDLDDWHLILVNKQNPVPDDYDAELASINGSLMADARIIDDVYAMLDAAKKDGVNLMICSAYRSYDRQTTLFNNKMNKLMNKGMSYMEAYAVGSMSVTVPGTSEHQLGLALDILTSAYTEMDDGFGNTEAGKWLKDNAPDYGFILRYPKGKEDVTGIIYEPWHFRYVGKDYSKEITDLGVTLEEFVNGEY